MCTSNPGQSYFLLKQKYQKVAQNYSIKSSESFEKTLPVFIGIFTQVNQRIGALEFESSNYSTMKMQIQRKSVSEILYLSHS